MRSILITGGSGSLGRALTRTLLSGDTERIAIYSRCEYRQAEMRAEFGSDERLRFFLGDVRDRDRLTRATKGCDTVIHTAALKRVDALEYNPTEAVQTNIMGAMNVVDAALECGVERVLAVSTDKASQPTTLYGATKLTMEKVVTAANAFSGQTGPRFACVRYGNVAGSRGSVIPLWSKLASEGRPLPITDTRMTRFHLRMDEAVSLVLRSLGRMKGGETFIPRAPSFKLLDLWRAMGGQGEPHVVGLRSVEKLHESLIGPEEAADAYDLGDDYVLCRAVADEPAPRTTGLRVPDGFSYTSDANDWWLSVEDLRREVGMLEREQARAA